MINNQNRQKDHSQHFHSSINISCQSHVRANREPLWINMYEKGSKPSVWGKMTRTMDFGSGEAELQVLGF